MKKQMAVFGAAVLVAGLAGVSFGGGVRLREARLWTGEGTRPAHMAKAASAPCTFDAKRAVVALSERLGVDVAGTEDLRLRLNTVDAFGRRHVRLQQLYKGVEVAGRELIVHFDTDGSVYEISGNWLNGLSLDVAPAVAAPADGAELVVFCNGGAAQARLAWRVRVARSIVFADALSGETLQVRPALPLCKDGDGEGGLVPNDLPFDYDELILTATQAALPEGEAVTLTGDLPVQQGGATVTVGATKGLDGKTYFATTNGDGVEIALMDGFAAPRFRNEARDAFERGDAEWFKTFQERSYWSAWSDDAEEDMPNAFAAMHNTATVLDYYKTAFGRRSYDGKGSRVAAWRFWNADINNLGTGYENAVWCRVNNAGFTPGCFFLGYDSTGRRSETSLDTCAHEFTHGVISWSANLEPIGEPGALHESFADIMAAACEFAAQPRAEDPENPKSGEADWLFDEDSGTPLRSFANPQLYSQASRYKGENWTDPTDLSPENDYGGIHWNSGVQNHFFYLLSEQIGVEKAAQIAYLTLTAYCEPLAVYETVTGRWESAALDLAASGVITEEDCTAVVANWEDVMMPPVIAPGPYATGVGEEVYALDGLLLRIYKPNASGRRRTTATITYYGQTARLSGWLEEGVAVLKARGVDPIVFMLTDDGAMLEMDGFLYPMTLVSPGIGEVEGLDDLRVGVAAEGLVPLEGDALKASFSAKKMPFGLHVNAKTGAITGVPKREGFGEATISANCTFNVIGERRPVKAKVARTVDWSVAPLDDYAKGVFASEGMKISVSKTGRISGYVVFDGRRVRVSAKSYTSYEDGVYHVKGKVKNGTFEFVAAPDRAEIEVIINSTP